MKRFFLLFSVMLVCAFAAHAQSSAPLSQYDEALGYYNPAAAGRTGNLDLMALYRLDWLGWNNAPKTLFVTANMPFRFMKKEHGLGVVLYKEDESSVYSYMLAGLQYAYLKKIGKGTLRVGLQAGMINMTVNGENVITNPSDSVASGDDEAIPTSEVTSKAFDANVGLYYGTNKWYVGLASMHILEPAFNDENDSTYMEREYNFIGGYNIQTKNPLIELQPSVFFKTNFNMYQANITAKAVYMNKYSGGLSWRMSNSSLCDALVLLLGVKFGKIQAGYAYEFPMSAVNKSTTGSHELYLRYSIRLNKPKVGKSKHKSVRIL